MDPSFNFTLNQDEPFSKFCIERGIKDFNTLCYFVKHLPYGRTKNRSDYASIIHENKGTCSTKHAFLKKIALENNANQITLHIGIYKMNKSNTKGIGNTLVTYGLSYIPEAHTYLKFHDVIYDYTSPFSQDATFKDSLLHEESILPEQIGNYKLTTHKNYIKNWVISKNIPYTEDEIWKIREACIAELSQ